MNITLQEKVWNSLSHLTWVHLRKYREDHVAGKGMNLH